MNKSGYKKLVTILDSNEKWPLIIGGVDSESISKSVVLPAITHTSELGIVAGETGLVYPAWLMEIRIKAKKSNKIYLVITGLDEIDVDEQEKFYGMIKYNGVNGYKFPAGTQIIIPIKKGNLSKINERIVSLCLNFDVE